MNPFEKSLKRLPNHQEVETKLSREIKKTLAQWHPDFLNIQINFQSLSESLKESFVIESAYLRFNLDSNLSNLIIHYGMGGKSKTFKVDSKHGTFDKKVLKNFMTRLENNSTYFLRANLIEDLNLKKFDALFFPFYFQFKIHGITARGKIDFFKAPPIKTY